jgi:hypothetical protein
MKEGPVTVELVGDAARADFARSIMEQMQRESESFLERHRDHIGTIVEARRGADQDLREPIMVLRRYLCLSCDETFEYKLTSP